MEWVALIIGITLLFIFPKQMGVLVGVTVAGIAGLFLYQEVEHIYRGKQKDAVSISIAYDLKACSEEYPIYVTVRNGGKKSVYNVRWEIEGYRRGYSNNLIEGRGYGSRYSSDKIISPGQSYVLCYKLPTIKGSYQPQTLNWAAGSKTVQFERS